MLASYTVLRPLRDELSSRWGTEGLQLSFTATFLSMLVVVPVFGFLSSLLSRGNFLASVFLFFSLGFIGFGYLFQDPGEHQMLARFFFTWVSVFNMVSISLVWSVINEVLPKEEAKANFGKIAIGAGLGAVLGPALTLKLVPILGTTNLIYLSTFLLLLCGLLSILLAREKTTIESSGDGEPKALHGGILSGAKDVFCNSYYAKIATIVFLSNVIATVLYFQQADFFKASLQDAKARTQLFASTDLLVNILTLGLQLFATDWLIKRAGILCTLLITPVLCIFGFSIFALYPSISILVGFQVLRRVTIYALTGPSKELLFSVGSEEEKYKTKNCIDTLVYRTGDTLGSWLYVEMLGRGASLGWISMLNIALCVLTALLAILAAQEFQRRQSPMPT